MNMYLGLKFPNAMVKPQALLQEIQPLAEVDMELVPANNPKSEEEMLEEMDMLEEIQGEDDEEIEEEDDGKIEGADNMDIEEVIGMEVEEGVSIIVDLANVADLSIDSTGKLFP
jgi:hypothetical protein